MNIYTIWFILLFSSCCAIPGYINKDGAITPKYFKEIQIESIKGFVSISPVETSKGITNVNPAKSDPLVSKKQKTIYLSERINQMAIIAPFDLT